MDDEPIDHQPEAGGLGALPGIQRGEMALVALELVQSQLDELRAAVLVAEQGVVDTGSYEIIHLDRGAWDHVVTLAKGGA